MKAINYLLVILFLTTLRAGATGNDSVFIESKISLQTKTGQIAGILTTPEKFNHIPVALIIAGSGPTDRDGNNSFMKNNSLKMLSAELLKKGIATLRFDKRGIGESKAAGKSEVDMRFEDYVNDAREWIELLKQDKRFSSVIVIGHSEGSLIGMIAAAGKADKFISIAGAGRPADIILKEQLSSQTKETQNMSFPIIDSLKEGKRVVKVNPLLYSLFRPSVQPYMISWFKYDPQQEIKKLSLPILILQGTNDIQVSVEDAKNLSVASPKARLALINNMNHVLKIVEGDRSVNIASYNNPTLPVSEELVKDIAEFILTK